VSAIPTTLKKSSEHLEQAAFFDWCRLNEKKYPPLQWIHAIPNGGLRNKRIASKLKREGVKSGVWDVYLPYPIIIGSDPHFYGLWIEFKYGNNKLTKNQRLFEEYVKKMGYEAVVVYSCDEAIKAVKKYLKKTK
jgi:hypothetical protein